MKEPEIKPEVDFSFVRYANCWEDAELLIKGLRPSTGKKIISIASAGDNALSLISAGAEVVAVDLNPAQIACCELRKEAIRLLERDDFLSFCGINHSENREEVYKAICPSLSEESQKHWNRHIQDIRKGFIHAGKFEGYFQLFRKRILPLIHRRKNVAKLMEKKSLAERISFYDNKWNNWRWRILFKLFFSRKTMGLLGRDPAFFNHVQGAVSERILERTHYALTQLDTSNNPYLSYILTGNFETLPFYLLPEQYNKVKQNIDNLTLRLGTINDVAMEFGENTFDGYNLSDIFEYLTPEQSLRVYNDLLHCAKPKARFAYWNMLVPRKCPEALQSKVNPLSEESDNLFKKDRAFFYSRFLLEEVK